MKTPPAAASSDIPTSSAFDSVPRPALTGRRACRVRIAVLAMSLPLAGAHGQALQVSTVAGRAGERGHVDAIGAEARFYHPSDLVTLSSGETFVADTLNHCIRRISLTGSVTTFVGHPSGRETIDGPLASARFSEPTAIAADATDTLYVGEDHAVRTVSRDGVVSTLAGRRWRDGHYETVGTGAAELFVTDLAVAAEGTVYVADRLAAAIRRVTRDGTVSTFAGLPRVPGLVDGPAATARFSVPTGIAFDREGNLLVCDSGNFALRRITPAGVVSTIARLPGLYGLARVVVGGDGAIYLSSDGTVHRVSPSGELTLFAGRPGSFGATDGAPDRATFFRPRGLATVADGILLLTDYENHNLRLIAPAPGAPATGSRLSNLSIRTLLPAAQTLIVGFATNGHVPLLVRAVGPGLHDGFPQLFPTTSVMPDPQLEIFDAQGRTTRTNDNWDPALQSVAAQVGAFPLRAGSLDAGLLAPLTGANTVHVRGTGAGIVLVDAYDATRGITARLTNVSARNHVGTGADILIAGFSIDGPGTTLLLVRGVGPTLRDTFGISGALEDPKLELFRTDGSLLAESDNWPSHLSRIFERVGAYPLGSGSRDAALLLALGRGAYTVQLSGVGGTTGEGLVEIYEVTPVAAEQTPTLTIATSGDGTVTASPGGSRHSLGSVVSLAATPAPGFTFLGWSGDATGTSNPLRLALGGPTSVTANFGGSGVTTRFTLALDRAGSGTGTVNATPPGPTYAPGTTVTLAATADSGSRFAGWSGDGTGSVTRTVVMDADKSVTATFTLQPAPTTYTVTIGTTGTGNGTVTATPAGPYSAGTAVTLTATPATGSRFEGWGGDISGIAPSTTVTVTRNLTIGATFTLVQIAGPASVLRVLPGQTMMAMYDPDRNFRVVNGGTLMADGGQPRGGYTWTTTTGSAAPLGVSVGLNGLVVHNGGALTLGDHALAVTVSDGTASANGTVTFRVVRPEIAASAVFSQLMVPSFSLAAGRVNLAYGATLYAIFATGTDQVAPTPLTWSLASGRLPPGLGLAADSGTVWGAPTEAGTFEFTVAIRGRNGETAAFATRYRITVNP